MKEEGMVSDWGGCVEVGELGVSGEEYVSLGG